MPAALPLKQPIKVSQLVRRRLRELKRTPRELAEAVNVSEEYMSDLVAGRRRPPAPGRTDLYVPMAKFLRLHRNDLPTCARVERAAERTGARQPHPLVWKRLLGVAQGFVARQLEDEVGLRIAATRDGCTYLQARMRLLEFLDATHDSITPRDCEEFIAPRITGWDMDLEAGAMRIVLR